MSNPLSPSNRGGLKDMYMAEFAFSLERNKNGKREFKVLKNRMGQRENIDDVTVYDYMLTAFTEVAFRSLFNDKSRIDMFSDGFKDKFKHDISEFIGKKFHELNERMKVTPNDYQVPKEF